MSIKIQSKHSATKDKAPQPTDLVAGELALNIHQDSPAIYLKDSAGAVRKIAGVGGVGSPDASETDKGVVELATAAETTTGTDTTRAVHPAGLKVELDKKAPLASPALTGVPTAPTAAAGTNTTQVATTEFVTAAVAAEDLWDRTGTEITTKTAGDSVFTTGDVKVGGTTAAPNITVKADGGIVANTDGLVYDAATKRVGIGSTAPSQLLHLKKPGATDAYTFYENSSSSSYIGTSSLGDTYIYNTGAKAIRFLTNNSERAAIDSSGRLLVGTSTARTNFNEGSNSAAAQIEGILNDSSAISITQNYNANTLGPTLILAKNNSQTPGTNVLVANGDQLGGVSFQGNDGSKFVRAASVRAEVDGTPGANDMPGRLVFSTTADGASSPTERMRITNSGAVLLQKTQTGLQFAGFEHNSHTFITRDGDVPLYVHRLTSDGTLVEFRQDNAVEGTISVSGTTVSYNGAHLSRWSQLPGGAEREEILRGTVLSNIDEMCDWGEEDNEQLNRMKVSDVEGDPNVAGVFQAWDDDDDTYTDDFYCAMTGDFIIRIAEGVTVQRGDLLMSAGDGTAKPQDDDIIRSKTVAKVTSTHVTCTYDDGSYCVPCVLMTC